MTQLAEAVVLLTGAGGGFGLELIRQLSAKGSRLILTDRQVDPLKSQAEALQTAVSHGEIISIIAADLSTDQGVHHLYQAVKQLNVPVDLLINNAGIAGYGRHDEIPAAHWEMLMQINLLAPMRLCSHIIPDMIARNRGHIVNISSLAGWVGTPGLAAYSASKFGLRGFGESLSEELSPYNIRVTTVYPYFSRTPIVDSAKFGSMAQRTLADSELTNPADVMAEVVLGIEQNKQHIFPDRMAKQTQFLKRHFPSLFTIIARRVQKRLETGLASS